MEPQPAQIESRVNQRFSNSPIFHWTKRFLLIFTAYISLYLLAKLIFFGIAYFFNSLNCDPCWITGILYLLIFLPFFPLLFLEQFLIYFGVGEFWSVTNLWSVAGLYLLGLIAAILLGLLFGVIRNKKISGGILIGTAVIAFLAYQIFVQDIFSQWASSNTETSSNLDLTKTEQKKSDLNTSTKSSVKSGWKVYNDLAFSFEYPKDWTALGVHSTTLIVKPRNRGEQHNSAQTIIIRKVPNPDNLTIEQIVHGNGTSVCCISQFDKSLVVSSEPISVSGVEGVRYYLGEISVPKSDEVYFIYKGYIYNIENNGGEDFDSTYETILVSFKILI